MSIITYTREVVMAKKILAVVLLAAGLFLIVDGAFFIGIMVLLMGINLFAKDGSQINLENKTYRNIKSIFGLKFGTWKPCPAFEYVSVFKTTESTNLNAGWATLATIKNEIIVLNIFYPRNKHITFYQTTDKADAFKVAEHFKFALDIDILDATGSENKWL